MDVVPILRAFRGLDNWGHLLGTSIRGRCTPKLRQSQSPRAAEAGTRCRQVEHDSGGVDPARMPVLLSQFFVERPVYRADDDHEGWVHALDMPEW